MIDKKEVSKKDKEGVNKKYKYLKFEKLIRDKNPQTIKNSGGECCYYNLENDEFIKNLKLKLVEEAKEVQEAKNIDEVADEIGDVIDVLKMLIKVAKIRKFKIWNSRRKKAKFRGKFKKGVYCKYVKIPIDVNEKWMYKYEDITEEIEGRKKNSSKTLKKEKNVDDTQKKE